MRPRLTLYQPDIPQNTGTILRLAACLGLGVDVIEPCGFVFSDRRMRRAGMDYVDMVDLVRHASWDAFLAASRANRRLILLTTKGSANYTEFAFSPEDTLILGRESAGVPDEVHEAVDARIVIPLAGDARSLNVALAAAMVAGEALRQIKVG